MTPICLGASVLAHYLHKPVAQRELHSVIAGILLPTPVVATAPAPVAEPVRDQTGLYILLAEDNLVNQKVARTAAGAVGSPLRGGEQRPGGAGGWRAACWDLPLIDLQNARRWTGENRHPPAARRDAGAGQATSARDGHDRPCHAGAIEERGSGDGLRRLYRQTSES
ncbi:hypothetical protein LOF14_00075 [Klebsiella variicola subsp. variicola]|nr:hypothetical protein LOF14_00075 [Klebsiella variicola subsp. variicola]